MSATWPRTAWSAPSGTVVTFNVPVVEAYGMTEAIADRLLGPMLTAEADVSGVGGTLTGNALALAAARATLSSALREQDYAVAVPLAERFVAGVAGVHERTFYDAPAGQEQAPTVRF